MTRAACLVFAILYLGQATWLLHAGVDVLFPRLAPATTADSCCASSCGCPDEVKARKDCCCGPAAARPAPSPVSSIDEARCKGVESALAQAVLQPTLCAFGRPPCGLVRSWRLALGEFVPDVPALATPPDKVPLG